MGEGSKQIPDWRLKKTMSVFIKALEKRDKKKAGLLKAAYNRGLIIGFITGVAVTLFCALFFRN